MTTTNEPKYKIVDGKLVNRVSNQAIPDDEPVFILRARDNHALDTLQYYQDCIIDSVHYEAVRIRMENFAKFRREHPDRMKEPDTVLTDDWKA